MKKCSILIVLLLIIGQITYSKPAKKKVEYSPIFNTSFEEAFPHVAACALTGLKVSIEKIDYSKKALKTSWFEYYSGILKFRCKFVFKIDETNKLDVIAADINSWNSTTKVWEKSNGGLLNTIDKYRASIMETIRQGIADKVVSDANKEWFFKDLNINSLIFEHLTDLAGDRWFDLYLKNQTINWKTRFVNIEKAVSEDYKYKESFAHSNSQLVSDLGFDKSSFFVVKFTNNDKNILKKRGEEVNLTGICRSLHYYNGLFYITLTDNIDEKVENPFEKEEVDSKPEKSVLEVADQLKKLKELLDMGVITEEDFNREKSNLLK